MIQVGDYSTRTMAQIVTPEGCLLFSGVRKACDLASHQEPVSQGLAPRTLQWSSSRSDHFLHLVRLTAMAGYAGRASRG